MFPGAGGIWQRSMPVLGYVRKSKMVWWAPESLGCERGWRVPVLISTARVPDSTGIRAEDKR